MFDVLAVLVRERDRVVTKDELLDAVWRHRSSPNRRVSGRIKSARRAIGDDGRAQRLIRTVHGRGYQFAGLAVERDGEAGGDALPDAVAPLVASALNVLGELARVHGDDATARAADEEGRALAIACGDAPHAAMFDGNLAFIAEHEGRSATAHRLATESLRQARALGRRLTGAEGISLLAGPELALGRPERSAMLIGASDEALRVMGVALPQGDRPEHARVVAGAREALGDQAYERLCAEGARLSLDEAIDVALGAMTGEVSPR